MAITLIQSTFKQLYNRLPRLLGVLFLSLVMASYAQALTLANQADFTEKPLTADVQLENDTLIVGSEQDYPPFATGLTDESAGGFTVELWKAVAAEAGLKYKIRVLPFHELLQEFKAGKIDVMLNLANTKERHVFADFSVPHSISHGGIFVRKSDSGIHLESDLAGKSVIVLNSDIAHDYALSKGWNKQLILADTVAEGMKLLASGKHDAMLINTLSGLQTLHALALTNIKILNADVGYSHKFAFAVRKNHSELCSQINEGFSIVKSNGTYAKLYEEWFAPYEVKEIGWRELLKYLSPIILLFFGFWQYSIYKRNIERKAAQKSLQESESKLSTILESVNSYIYLKDMQGRYIFANRSVRDLFGVSMEGLVGQGDERFFDSETVCKSRENDRLVLDQGLTLRTEETKMNLYDGASYTVLSVKIPLRDETGQIYGLCGYCTDISDRKASEDKLRASNERHHAILSTAMDGFWQLDVQGHLLEVNVTYCQMSGYSEQELLTMHISDVDAMVSTVDISEHLKMVISQGESRFESKHHRKDGSIFDIELSIQYLNVDGGRLIVFLRDITERKESEANLYKTQTALQANQIELESQNQELYQTQTALITSRDRYVDLYEFAPIGYLSVSQHGMITEINWKATAMFGFSRKQLVQKRFAQFISNDDKARWQRQFSNLKDFKGGEELSFNLKFVHENGIIFHASLNCLRMDDDKSQPMLRITLMDITQVEELEQAQRQASVRLQAMFDAIPDLMFEVGLNGRVYSIHSPRINLFTVAPENLIGRLIAEFLPEDATAVCMAALKEANEKDYSSGKQFKLILEQDLMWFELSVARKQVLTDDEPRFVVLSRDITEHKQAAERICKLIDEKNAVLNNRLVGIVTVRDRKILWANLAYEIMLGYSENEMVGLATRALYLNEEDYHKVGAAYADIEDAGIVRMQIQYLRKDGQPIWLSMNGAMLNKEAGESLWVFIDLTVLKDTQESLAESHHLLKAIIDNAPMRIFWKDKNLRFLGCNPAFAKDAGVACTQDIIGKDDYDFAWSAQADLYRADDFAVIASGKSRLFYDEPQTTPTGQTIWLRTAKVPLINQADETFGVLGIYEEITQQKLIENDLRIAATAFESQEGMLVTDAKNVILRVNSAFTKVTGYTAADTIGQTPRLLKSDHHDADFYTAMWTAINSNGIWEGEIWNRRKNGEVYPGYLNITAVTDNTGVVINYVATLTDITLNKAATEEIHHLAFYDALTSLPNRRLLLDRLNQALVASARSGKEGAVLFLDLDHFKTLNDTLGHDIGDALLRQVAERLTACVREGDTVARLGGDEYVIMLEDLSEHDIEAATQAEVIGKKILATLNLPYQLGEHEHHSTSSIGITLFNDHKSGMEELLKQADIAMYQAKKSGRNMLRFFDREMQNALHARVDIERELRRALEKKQFNLYYQIQVESSGHAMGAEALIRWLHPERGLVPPFDFISLAEETGLIIPIGLWVLETACAQLRTWEQQTHTQHLTLSVNVSAKQFRQPDFVTQVKTAIQHHAINPMLLKFELTESILLENIEDTITTMNALKDVGIRFSLDDFGTGYSSLQYLKLLPLYQLKIDQSFVRDIAVDSSDQAIVRTIIAMAHTLNLNVIAEGVETEEQKRLLLNNDCTHYQGYLFGHPMPIGEFEATLKAL